MIAMLILIVSLALGIAAMWMHFRQRYELSNILFLMFDIGVIATILLQQYESQLIDEGYSDEQARRAWMLLIGRNYL